MFQLKIFYSVRFQIYVVFLSTVLTYLFRNLLISLTHLDEDETSIENEF